MGETPQSGNALRRGRWRVEYGALQGLATVLAVLPHPARLKLGRVLGRVAFLIDRRHARVALANVSAAYPAATPAWHRQIAKESFEHLGRLLVEILLQDRLAPQLGTLLDVEGIEHLHAVTSAGRGYFLLSGHFGNWEWVAAHQATLGHPLWMITRPLDNPMLESLLAARRQVTGNRVVHKRNAVREMVKGVRLARGIAIVIDQDFLSPGAHFVPFFGRPAATTPALGTLAYRLQAPVLPVFSYPLPAGRYRVVYEEPIPPPEGADADAAAQHLTQLATARLEAAIRRHPSAWFWMHNRWRTRPPGEGPNPPTPALDSNQLNPGG